MSIVFDANLTDAFRQNASADENIRLHIAESAEGKDFVYTVGLSELSIHRDNGAMPHQKSGIAAKRTNW